MERNDSCPDCGSEITFDEVDIGVGTLKGNFRCDSCGWSDYLNVDNPKNPNAVALGRLGGLKRAKTIMQKSTPERRREIATKAAAARWQKHDHKPKTD